RHTRCLSDWSSDVCSSDLPQARLDRLESHLDLIGQRDDLTVERAALLNLLGRPQEALDLLLARKFHPWEGGEGKVTGQYVASLRSEERRVGKECRCRGSEG